MAQKITLGGERLGTGKKEKITLHGYERSNHDLGYLWRSSMAAGTLLPFLLELALPGDTFDISLESTILTHPTLGPLFASFKAQYDIFQAPIRLYQGALHNNKLGIGLKMANVKLPQITLTALPNMPESGDVDNLQINPSSILSYLNIRGVGTNVTDTAATRNFNAVPLLAYWDIYKNYYSNKQEEVGYYIYTPPLAIINTVTEIDVNDTALPIVTGAAVGIGTVIIIKYSGTAPQPYQIIFNTSNGPIPGSLALQNVVDDPGVQLSAQWNAALIGQSVVYDWTYIGSNQVPTTGIQLKQFDLSTIDDMREAILSEATNPAAFIVNDHVQAGDPWDAILTLVDGNTPYIYTQQGLGIKTYQSDLFNNWLNTTDIAGSGGITEITSISTAGNVFTIDTLLLNKKIYDFLNRVSVSGGTYDDWLDVTYDHDRYTRAETPIYHGGMSKELAFQEVVSLAQAAGAISAQPNQPLGTLGGRGKFTQKHKGGKITIRVDEPSYIIGIVSLTPRLDYSQGNKWDTHLQTMDDLHKPALDEIGFQPLITEQMAWFGTIWTGTAWQTNSAGFQPAWINYMTNVNQTRGNFAILNNEMFMTLNRKYAYGGGSDTISDLTTYIDPSKYNSVFAQTSLDSQNFWTQIAVNMNVRRKISAKVMPNL